MEKMIWQIFFQFYIYKLRFNHFKLLLPTAAPNEGPASHWTDGYGRFRLHQAELSICNDGSEEN